MTGSTGLIYKGSDGTGRVINPNNYQPVGSYATTAQLDEVKTSVSNGKSLIASAITDKGVSTASDATFQTMSNNIRKINQNAPILLYTNTNVSAGIENYKTNITLPSVNYNAFLIEFKYTSMQAYGAGGVTVGDPNNSAIIYYTKSQLNIGAVAYVSGSPTTQEYSTYRRDMKLTNNILYCGDAGHQDSYHPHLDSKYLCIPYRIWGINILL